MVNPSTTSQTASKTILLLARPFVRFCLRHSVTFWDLQDVLKRVYVQSGRDEIQRDGGKINISRLSVITGLHRNEVTALLNEKSELPDGSSSLLARVIGRWEQDPDFSTSAGKPRILTHGTMTSEFNKLVEKESKTVNPASVLAELLRIQAVLLTTRGVKFFRAAPPIGESKLAAFEILSQDIGNLIQAVEENIAALESNSNLHIRTVYDNVYEKHIPKIREWMLLQGKAFHRRARAFISKMDKDIRTSKKPSDRAGAKVVLTAFSFTEVAAHENEPTKGKE